YPVRQLGENRLGDDDGAPVAQVLGDGGLVGRPVALEGDRAARGRHVGGVDIVLERDGDAVEGTPYPTLSALTIPGVRLLEHPRIHHDDCLELILVKSDPREVFDDDLTGRDATVGQGLAQLGDPGFDHREAPGAEACTPWSG